MAQKKAKAITRNAFAKNFLDETFPLAQGSHADATKYAVEGNALVVSLKDGSTTTVADAAKFVGYNGEAAAPTEVVLKNNGLHVIIQIDANSPIGQTDASSGDWHRAKSFPLRA